MNVPGYMQPILIYYPIPNRDTHPKNIKKRLKIAEV